jgi:enamine deaminase RidA (YjgF/YER057c/UK114 family)
MSPNLATYVARSGMRAGEIGKRLQSLGIVLPPPPTPKGAYLPVVVTDHYAWVSGMLPLREGKLVAEGLVESEVALPVAKDAARLAALNGLSALSAAIGELERVERVVKVGVYVASSTGFVAQSEVANGASELLVGVFGDLGKHARIVVGVASLPLNSPVMVELEVAL